MSTIFFKVKDRETGEVISDEARYENGVITSDHWMKPGVKTLMYWDNANEPDEWVSEISGRDAVLVATSEVNDRGEVVRRFDESGYDSEGRDWQGFDTSGWDKDGYDREGYDKNGFDFYGYHRDTGTDLDEDGYDSAGYDTSGRDRNGFDREGFDKEGYNRDGYDRDGYDEDGYDPDFYDRDGYDPYGYDIDGYDRDGYDEDGYNEHGYDRDGNSKSDLVDESPSDDQREEDSGGIFSRIGKAVRSFASDRSEASAASQRPSNPFGGDATVSGGKGHEGKPMVDGYEYINKNGKRVHVDSYKNPRYKGPRR